MLKRENHHLCNCRDLRCQKSETLEKLFFENANRPLFVWANSTSQLQSRDFFPDVSHFRPLPTPDSAKPAQACPFGQFSLFHRRWPAQAAIRGQLGIAEIRPEAGKIKTNRFWHELLPLLPNLKMDPAPSNGGNNGFWVRHDKRNLNEQQQLVMSKKRRVWDFLQKLFSKHSP